MKKLAGILSAAFLSLALVACGPAADEQPADQTDTTGDTEETTEATDQETVKLVVGASNVPHAEILEEAAPLLLEEGIEIEVRRFQDYVLPNKTLADGELDANYFQHIPYLTAQNEQEDYGFVNAGGIHIEPIGIYSQKWASLDELPEGAEIIMSSAIPDHGRILAMLEQQGLITLAEGVGITATLDDIEENPKNFKFQDRVEASLLPQAYLNGEGDAVLINSNFALGAGLSPGQDAIALESPENNPYVNVIAVRGGDEEREEIQKLVEVLQSEAITNFILERWGGDVVPAN
ncbi:methionine ABC transporter substrate-binding protein [Anaerobacillus alkalidiazotrophicus]|uniref:Lipoprotein n=1 Tax=Anaerobacillus alkalidiazotrophicus TaxID=472963 RepID=A0A1S2M2V8_9BACI|nr:MetQ/NlpA family ABC transporter substrate-binding protein [Anaerobacillus alkalidiazotrophicus]OIJ18860.1 methionine ABC transporter substrate-binding protein [Anaerobacillus alkalidiazotrophicus]